jgi:hypothetical protein
MDDHSTDDVTNVSDVGQIQLLFTCASGPGRLALLRQEKPRQEEN